MVPLTSPRNLETKYEVSQASPFSTYKIFSREMFGEHYMSLQVTQRKPTRVETLSHQDS